VGLSTNLRDALAIMVTEASETIAVTDETGRVVGGLTFGDIVTGVREGA
jgi:CBS domain-containing protein